MTAKILAEYINAFRLSNFKKLGENNRWWIYINMLSLFPLCFGRVFDATRDFISYYLIVLPLLFNLLNIDLYPLTLPKMMFLCPMSGKERVQYIRNCYCMKVVISTLADSVFLVVLILLDYLNPLAALYMLFVFFCVSAGSQLSMDAHPGSMEKKSKGPKILQEFTPWSVFHMISGWIIIMITYFFAQDAVTDGNRPIMIALSFVGLLWIGLLTGKMLHFYHPVMAAATDYETSVGLPRHNLKKETI